MNIPERDTELQCGELGPDLSEKRKAIRVAVLIRAAKLVCEHGEFLCVVRDVSEDGVKLRLFHPLPASGPLQLELSTGERFLVESVWQEDGVAGFQFVDPVDLRRFIAEASPYPKRPVRLRISCPATIKVDERICEVTIRDLSREGISIETTFPLALEQKLTLQAGMLEPRIASVRWRKSPVYGLALQHILSFEELARTAARMQLPAELLGAIGSGEERQRLA